MGPQGRRADWSTGPRLGGSSAGKNCADRWAQARHLAEARSRVLSRVGRARARVGERYEVANRLRGCRRGSELAALGQKEVRGRENDERDDERERAAGPGVSGAREIRSRSRPSK